METYKLGNKVNCIIRSHNAGQLGDTVFQYANQPYTILKDIEASLTYTKPSTDIRVGGALKVSYNKDYPTEIRLSNILITDKILNLIYSKNETKLCNVYENLHSDDEKKIFLTTMSDEVYQVFIYNHDGLEAAYGTLDVSEGIAVKNADEEYLIYYSYLGTTSVNLDKPENFCVKLDIEITGNIDDTTNVMWLHLDKCALVSDKNLTFNRSSNTVDLTFKILNDSDTNNYLTLK